MELTPVTIYVNSSCKGNPGPGGWAAIVVCKNAERNIEGNELQTTNNKMELTAVVEGLKLLKHNPCHVNVITQSDYPVMNKEKYERLRSKDDWPNKELWEELVNVCNKYRHHVSYNKAEPDADKAEKCKKFAKREAELALQMTDDAILPGKSCKELIEKLMLEERRISYEERLRKLRGESEYEFSNC